MTTTCSDLDHPGLSRERLRDALEVVLETMFFLPPDDLRAEPVEIPAAVGAQLRFTGARTGGFGLLVSPGLAQTLALNFYGELSSDIASAAEVEAVVFELANVICGNFLSRLEAGDVFSLSAPQPWEPPARGEDIAIAASAFCEGEWLSARLWLLAGAADSASEEHR
ncbi:MAG: chemotaxis protein CheX [Bryobacter sp.]|nr:chemotaxis protein CheX [Bryobacter sp.]